MGADGQGSGAAGGCPRPPPPWPPPAATPGGARGSWPCRTGKEAPATGHRLPARAGPHREPVATASPCRPCRPCRPTVLRFPHPRAQHRRDPPPPQPPGAALALPANQLLSGPRSGCYSYGPALAPGRATASPRGHRTGTAVTRSDPLQTTPLQTWTYRN